MPNAEPVRYIPPDELVEGPPTPGMVREQAIDINGLWAGIAHTDAGMRSGWHHHGEYDTAVYVVSGTVRMESGPNGESVVDAGPGEFLHVPRGAIHREGNPSDEEGSAVVVRSGGPGPTIVNVDGPAGAED